VIAAMVGLVFVAAWSLALAIFAGLCFRELRREAAGKIDPSEWFLLSIAVVFSIGTVACAVALFTLLAPS
jgi:hypothetical protein